MNATAKKPIPVRIVHDGPSQPGKASSAPKRKPPFSAHSAGGVVAKGRISGARESYDGSGMEMTVKHGKTGSGGLGSYPDEETRVCMDPDCAKHFPVGQEVEVHVRPTGGKARPKSAIASAYDAKKK